jgi:hypothetical protein
MDLKKKGNTKAPAMPFLSAAISTEPNDLEPIFIKIKELPHTAPNKKSINQESNDCFFCVISFLLILK